jgi:hypothetical protein
MHLIYCFLNFVISFDFGWIHTHAHTHTHIKGKLQFETEYQENCAGEQNEWLPFVFRVLCKPFYLKDNCFVVNFIWIYTLL